MRLNKDKIAGRNIVNILYELCRKPVLADAIRAHAGAWMEAAKQIVASLSDTPDLHQAELMLTNLQLVIGVTQ
jgi:hypothetical protein